MRGQLAMIGLIVALVITTMMSSRPSAERHREPRVRGQGDTGQVGISSELQAVDADQSSLLSPRLPREESPGELFEVALEGLKPKALELIMDWEQQSKHPLDLHGMNDDAFGYFLPKPNKVGEEKLNLMLLSGLKTSGYPIEGELNDEEIARARQALDWPANDRAVVIFPRLRRGGSVDRVILNNDARKGELWIGDDGGFELKGHHTTMLEAGDHRFSHLLPEETE